MKLTLRLAAVLAFVCSTTTLSAAPLLFINFSQTQTHFAQQRAESLGLSYSTLNDFNYVSDLQGKSVVIMPSAGVNFTNRFSILSDFVEAGGYVWINISGGGCATDFVPGGVDFVQYSCGGNFNNSNELVSPTHKYLQGTFDPRAHQLSETDFMNWNQVDIGHLTDLPSNATTITKNSMGATLAEYSYGLGWVVASSLTYAWGDAGAKGAPLDNMLLYAANQVRSDDTSEELPGTATPEPGSLLLAASGCVFCVTRLRRR